MHIGMKAVALAALLGICLPSPAPAVERIWDNELRRYLTEAELNHAEVFMSEEEARETHAAEIPTNQTRVDSSNSREETSDRRTDRLEIS